MSLVLCAQCDRHIRHNETACPFCGAPHTPLTFAQEPGKKGWIQPLSRAAIVFFGASAITAAASACDKDGPPPNTPAADSGAAPAPTSAPTTAPSPANRDGGTSANPPAPTPTTPMPVALYGVAPVNK